MARAAVSREAEERDVLALAAVLRDLAAQPRLTAREDQLHDRLRALLASELACALQIDITQAGTYIARRSRSTKPGNTDRDRPQQTTKRARPPR